MSRLLAIVPARGGSKGLPGKNLRPLAGVPLWRRAAEQGLAAGAGEVLVTTDIAELLDAPATPGITMIARPEHLARDDTPMAPVLLDLLADPRHAGALCVLLQPTSPLRRVEDIAAALALYARGGTDLVLTVTEADRGVLKYGRLDGDRFRPLGKPEEGFTNRQALPPVYRPNGAVYVFARDWFLANGGFASPATGAVVMPAERSFDIDTSADFEAAERALAGG